MTQDPGPTQIVDLIPVVDKAIELMSVPHAVVKTYVHFTEDEAGNELEYGDPAACRFCVAGVVRHAAYLLRGPGENGWHPLTEDEEDCIAAACMDNDTTLLQIFDEAWLKARVDEDQDDDAAHLEQARLEQAREHIVGYLRSGREVLFIKAGEPDDLAVTS